MVPRPVLPGADPPRGPVGVAPPGPLDGARDRCPPSIRTSRWGCRTSSPGAWPPTRARRYPDCAALAEDLRRHLSHRPLVGSVTAACREWLRKSASPSPASGWRWRACSGRPDSGGGGGTGTPRPLGTSSSDRHGPPSPRRGRQVGRGHPAEAVETLRRGLAPAGRRPVLKGTGQRDEGGTGAGRARRAKARAAAWLATCARLSRACASSRGLRPCPKVPRKSSNDVVPSCGRGGAGGGRP